VKRRERIKMSLQLASAERHPFCDAVSPIICERPVDQERCDAAERDIVTHRVRFF
jgi:hypothetical protein